MPKGGDFRTARRPSWIEARGDALVLVLHVQPGARRTSVVGLHGDRLKIAVSSPPTDGRANAAVIEFLAGRLRVSKSAIELLSGATSREKRVAVRGPLDATLVAAALLPGERQ